MQGLIVLRTGMLSSLVHQVHLLGPSFLARHLKLLWPHHAAAPEVHLLGPCYLLIRWAANMLNHEQNEKIGNLKTNPFCVYFFGARSEVLFFPGFRFQVPMCGVTYCVDGHRGSLTLTAQPSGRAAASGGRPCHHQRALIKAKPERHTTIQWQMPRWPTSAASAALPSAES